MSYYKKVLRPGEAVLFLGELHPVIYLRPWMLVGAGFVAGAFWLGRRGGDPRADMAWAAAASFLIGVGAFGLLDAWIRRRTTEIVVTSLRVIIKRGLVRRRTTEMNMSKIETVDVQQGVLARLLGFGTVTVRGTGSGLEPLPRISRPLALRNAILVG